MGERKNLSLATSELDAARKHKDLQLQARTLVAHFGRKLPEWENCLVVGPVRVIEDGQKRLLIVVKKMDDEEPNDSTHNGNFIILEEKKGGARQTLHIIETNPPLDHQKEVIKNIDMASRRLSSIEEALDDPDSQNRVSTDPFVDGFNSLPISP